MNLVVYLAANFSGATFSNTDMTGAKFKFSDGNEAVTQGQLSIDQDNYKHIKVNDNQVTAKIRERYKSNRTVSNSKDI